MHRTPHHYANICGVSVEVGVALPLRCYRWIIVHSCLYIRKIIFDVVVGHVLVRSGGRRRRRCYTGASAGRSEGVKEVALVCSPPWLVSVGRRDIVLCRQGSGS